MVRTFENLFVLETLETTYAFQVMDTGHLEHLYYGKKIPLTPEVARAVSVKHVNLNGCAIQYDKEHPALCMNDVLLEVSGRGTGDMRSPFVELVFADGSNSVDFVYESHEVLGGKRELETLPSAYGENVQTLRIVLKEKYMPVKLELYYSVFEDCDVITRSCKLVNEGEESVEIQRIMSMQLDLNGGNMVMTSFHGDWAREMNRVDTTVKGGRVVNTSATGFSSNHANPFVMLFAEGSSEDAGEGYGFNLVYSGPHMELAEVSSQGQTRFLAGISPEQFCWTLSAGESFETPEAVMTFSAGGYSKMSRNMHRFVREHIVRGVWKKTERPVLLNSWEASYFNITESSLLKLAKAGKEAGIELFVMDDGWFGQRNDDTSSLGDWEVNTKKLPGGIKGLADKIVKLGLMFGIWVEPEMVNENSDLYRAHPDWAIKHPDRNHGEGRHQMLLDLSREEVQDYLIEAMSKVFSAGDITYVKWDMNRNFSDVYSSSMGAVKQGELLHRYMMGLYRVMGELVKRFPNILFEGCASGGNRFDLGILCYMPQIWASDNSDAISRCYIQNGLSYGYPQSVIGAHVSSCPNHQTLRNTPLETRFAVASMGVLGYECNLAEMKKEEVEAIKEQIALYKKWRKTLQFGQLHRIGGKLTGVSLNVGIPANNNLVEWNIVSEDGEKAVAVMVQETVKPHTSQITLRTKGLTPEYMYHFTTRALKYDIKLFGDLVNMIAPIHIKKDSLVHNTVAKFIKMDGETEDYTLPGSVLNNCGVALAQSFAGTGYNANTRLYQDFDARMYFIEKE
ncbi:MAG: alpha-galactosidase [Lachnospiraceae bacterium]|nr:alpha-galactosidase [Lachnospiraceae bacterium]